MWFIFLYEEEIKTSLDSEPRGEFLSISPVRPNPVQQNI